MLEQLPTYKLLAQAESVRNLLNVLCAMCEDERRAEGAFRQVEKLGRLLTCHQANAVHDFLFFHGCPKAADHCTKAHVLSNSGCGLREHVELRAAYEANSKTH